MCLSLRVRVRGHHLHSLLRTRREVRWREGGREGGRVEGREEGREGGRLSGWVNPNNGCHGDVSCCHGYNC